MTNDTCPLDRLYLSAASSSQVYAAKSLKAAFRKAILHILRILDQVNPSSRIFRILQRFRLEVLLMLDLVLESYHLSSFCSSWAENYIGIVRRFPAASSRKSTLLFQSLADLAIRPYFLDKLEDAYLRLRDSGTSLREKKFVLVYPYIRYVLSLLDIHSMIKYALALSPYPSLLSRIFGLHLQRRTTENKRDALRELGASSGISSHFHGIFRSFGKLITVCSFLAYFWSNYASAVKESLIVIPPPPKTHCSFPRGKCPVCGKRFVNPVVIRENGLVFCEGCVVRFVALHGTCPATGVKLDVSSVIRVYAEA